MGEIDLFSLLILILAGVMAILFFLGVGGKMLESVTTKDKPKRTKEEDKKYQRACGVFCLVVVGVALIFMFLSPTSFIWTLVGILIVIVDIAVLMRYLHKNFPDK